MSLLQGIARIKERFATMGRAEAEDALRAGLDAAALSKSRVQQSGEGIDGRFEDYTPDYARDRRNAGYQTEHVDFTRTGGLMASIGPAVVDVKPGRVVVEIKASRRSEQVKLNGAAVKRGNIIANTPEEQRIVGEAFARAQVARLK